MVRESSSWDAEDCIAASLAARCSSSALLLVGGGGGREEVGREAMSIADGLERSDFVSCW